MNSFTLERNNYRRKLITLVKQNSILWNKHQVLYNKKLPQKMEAWQNISVELNITVDKLRRTWENLRDQYRRDLKREMKYGFKSKWRFFNDMDFIRPMVTCKESQNGYTDSESESEAYDQKTQQLNRTQCSVITTNLTTTTTPTLTIPAIAINSEIPKNDILFQPIVLSKQWQQLNNKVTPLLTDMLYTNPADSNSSPGLVICDQQQAAFGPIEYSTNCDSSRDTKFPQPSPPIKVYKDLPKEEPDLDFENNTNTFSNEEEINNTCYLNVVQDEREFQEPSVSTSCVKCTRLAEDSTDTSAHCATKLSGNSESDIEIKDDDYYFVMSLLPSLRQIPRNRKFPLRLGIMNLIAKDLDEVVKDIKHT